MISAGPLRRLLIEREITPSLLADASGLPLSTVKNFIADNGITIDNINKLCKALNVQPKDLIKYYEKEF